MALCRFSVIVAVDAGNGISKEGEIPWNSRDDMKFFRDTTLGRGKNVIIMGRVTYESLPEERRPLEGRHNVVISNTWKQEKHSEISIYPSLHEALAGIGGSVQTYDKVFICGGEKIYNEVLENYMYLCDNVYVTKFKTDYSCDQFFCFDKVKDLPPFCEACKTRDYTRYTFNASKSYNHAEYEYLSLLERVVKTGERRPDRTGIGTLSLFGERMCFDISDRIPLLTTKKMFYEGAIRELLFFISGKTDTRLLEQQGTKIWHDNTSGKFLKDRKLDYDDGDMGPMYGWQMRHAGLPYPVKGFSDPEFSDKGGIDQLKNVVQSIRDDPFSRRHIISMWSVPQIDQMVLAPCHVLVQFNVSADKKNLDCQLYQRSGDLFLGLPWNIISYTFLTYMIAHITGLRPRKLIHIIGDAHVYLNHQEQVSRQLKRTPRPLPKLTFRNSTRLHEIDDFTFENFCIENYVSCPAIPAQMAV